ncbi:MAG: DNA polymerase I [Phycisphaerae bacterium]|jgi:DNA polymerase-1
MAETLYILDGHYQIYRAFFAPFRDLTSPSGEPTRATYVFCQMLLGLIRDRRPDYLAVALDAGDETTFRRELDPGYKAQRDPPPETLPPQADRIVSIVSALGIPTFILTGYEADDLMATIADKLRDDDVEVFLVSRDKDLEQLLTDKVRLLDVSKNQVVDPAALLESKGYTPEQAVEIQTLTGDSTDNVPGVPGIGVKTAAKLISEYGSAQAVIDNADNLTPKMKERVSAFADRLELTRQLVTLRRDVPVQFSLADCRVEALNFAAVKPIFQQLGFGRLTEQLDEFIERSGSETAQTDAAPASEPAVATAAPLRGEYHLIDTVEVFAAFVESLAARPAFAFDTETTGLNPVASDLVGLSFSWNAGQAYYVPVRGLMGSTVPLDAVVAKLKPVFENPEIGKIGQNLKYDVLVLKQVGIDVKGLAFDTLIASFLLEPLARSRSLDTLARKYFDHTMIPISDLIGKGKKQITLDQVDTRQVCEYAAEDADFTWRLNEVLEPRMTGSYAEALFRDTEMPLIEVLVEMTHNGIALDTSLLSKLSTTLSERMDALTGQIHHAAGHPFNIDSTKQLAVVLFDEQGLEPVRKTKTGRSTDHDTLQALVERTENPIPPLVLEYRELTKLKGTYVDTLPKMISPRTGRVHASFDQTGAVTGRLSSSDPNLQNIPVRTETGRQIRKAFVAGDPANVLLTADYSQIELRILAHFCEDEALVEAFRTGQDIHRTVAAQVNGVSPEEVTPAQRSAAKAVNFGIIYGQGAFGLARSLGIPVGEARSFINAYFERYPGIRAFIDRCIEQAKSTGYAETILGRRRPVEELQSKNRQQVSFGERIAVNTVVQGSAADLIKRAMIAIHSAYKAGEHQARMLIQVHDELVFEVAKTDLEQAADLVRDRMENAMPLTVPLVADINSGPTWAESK